MISDNVFVVVVSALRPAYKQLSFSRYAYDGEDQCLSPLPHNGDLLRRSTERKVVAEIKSMQSVDGAKKMFKKTLKKNAEEAYDPKRSK